MIAASALFTRSVGGRARRRTCAWDRAQRKEKTTANGTRAGLGSFIGNLLLGGGLIPDYSRNCASFFDERQRGKKAKDRFSRGRPQPNTCRPDSAGCGHNRILRRTGER